MKLYFSPLACSLAPRIAFYEARAEVTYVEVDPTTKRTNEGRDFLGVHALGLVPVLETGEGEVLSENAAILQFIAEAYPEAQLAPEDAHGRDRLRQWLGFIATELHKALYTPLLDKAAATAVHDYALQKAEARLRWVADHLEGREFLLDRFSVADAYLVTVLNWSAATPVDLKPWPAIRAYHAGLHNRPSVARAFGEERERYLQELARDAERTALPASRRTSALPV